MELHEAHPRIRNLDDLPEMILRPELAEFLGLSVATLARWAGLGLGPKVTKLGVAARYRKADVLAWIEEQAAKASA